MTGTPRLTALVANGRGLLAVHEMAAQLLHCGQAVLAPQFDQMAVEQFAHALLARARARAVTSLVWFVPTFMLSIYVCTRAWLSSFVGAEYTWVKTARSGG